MSQSIRAATIGLANGALGRAIVVAWTETHRDLRAEHALEQRGTSIVAAYKNAVYDLA